MFEDSNKNGRLDKAEILAAMVTPDMRLSKSVRALFSEFARDAEELNQEIKQKKVNQADLERIAVRLNEQLSGAIDRKTFPDGVALTAADIPSIIALFCATSR